MSIVTVLKKIFVGEGANYVEFQTDGDLILHGNSRVTNHVNIGPKRFQIPATNYPGQSFEGLVYTLDFDAGTEQNAHVVTYVPYRWDDSTDIAVAIAWFHDTNQADAAKKVLWGVEYKGIATGEAAAGAGTEISQLSAGNHDVDQGLMVRTVFTTKILAANLTYDDCLAIRVFRKAADPSDTVTEDARLVHFHVHFTRNRLGEPL